MVFLPNTNSSFTTAAAAEFSRQSVPAFIKVRLRETVKKAHNLPLATSVRSSPNLVVARRKSLQIHSIQLSCLLGPSPSLVASGGGGAK